VGACPCQTIVPHDRDHVFARIRVAANARIDMGNMPAEGRLGDTGGLAKEGRITRRVPVRSVDESDAELEHWLGAARDRDAGGRVPGVMTSMAR
jgi:hypothetical protein